MKNDITALTASALSAALSAGDISAREAAAAYYKAIDKTDGETGAYLAVTKDTAFAAADEADARRRAGESLPPLAGVPMGVADNICAKDAAATSGSKMLEHFVPPYDAFAVGRLKKAGAPMLGKLNVDEFGMGESGRSAFKETRNPRAPLYVSGAGGAACVAAGTAAFAVGSDGGGGVRIPACYCGVVGLKPTYGTVSRNGLIAFVSSMEQIGPFTRDVRDAALVYNVIAGHDPGDSTSHNRGYPDAALHIGGDIKNVRIALPDEVFDDNPKPEIKDALLFAAERFERLGAAVSRVSMPSLSYALPAYLVISGAEGSSNLARYDGAKYRVGNMEYGDEDMDAIYRRTRGEGFGMEAKRRILFGSFALGSGNYEEYYGRALKARTLIIRDYERVLEKNHIVLSPVTPDTAPLRGGATGALDFYRRKIYTAPPAMAGLPALSMPCAADDKGLFTGIQLVGRAFCEAELFRAGHAFEKDAGIGISAGKTVCEKKEGAGYGR